MELLIGAGVVIYVIYKVIFSNHYSPSVRNFLR